MAGEKNGGRAGHIGKAMGQQAAGARFSHSESLPARGELENKDFFQLLVIDAVDTRAEFFANNGFSLSNAFHSPFPTRGEAHVNFAGAGAVADFQSLGHQFTEHGRDVLFDGGFAHANGFERANGDGIFRRQFFSKQGRGGLGEHGPQFARRAGK